jgi:LacI family transcriptional regulator
VQRDSCRRIDAAISARSGKPKSTPSKLSTKSAKV